ncbi:MAG: type VI secretion system ATPase TssH [Nitrospina sp.]|nr:type VI secretion system ATPase TssH [Nitrospina sp.]
MKFDLKELIGKLNGTCRSCLETAAALCVSQTHYNVEVEHFLVKMLDVPDSDLNRILKHYDLNASEVNRELMAAIDQFDRGNNRTPAFSLHLMELFQEGWIMSSLVFGEQQVRSGAIVLGMLSHEALRGVMVESSKTLMQIPRHKLRQDVKELCKGTVEDPGPGKPAPKRDTGPQGTAGSSAGSAQAPAGSSKNPALDQFTVDLTQRARDGQIDPIQGRDFEIRQVIDILTRRRQNNPILTGEAGVGKTAVAEGFALRIATGDVPPSLKQVSLRSLDLGLLQAGAGVKGEFENRLKSVIGEVKASPTPIILFIDEAHTLIGAGAGGQQGQSDAANLLKPALARGELRTIAATTWSEYKKYFEKDPALTRRFQVVKVDEPRPEVAIDMVRGIVSHLEQHHQVVILDEAVADAVNLSDRYITGRQLPDKAISVLDTACARVGLGQNATPPKVEDAQRRIELIRLEVEILNREMASGRAHDDRLANLQTQLEGTQAELKKLEARWNTELDMVKEIHRLREETEGKQPEGETAAVPAKSCPEIIELEQKLEAFQGEEPMVPVFVDSRVVASVISGWTGIPVGRMLTNEIQNVLDLKENLQKRVVGQDSGLEAICRRIRTSRAQLDDPGKPVGVFLLAGPSGVGKTETALALADLLYGGERNLVKINMSEYQESYTVSNLKGSPPGYVGFGQGGVLTEAVRRAPYSVVLLDEIEKAHNDVVELFYQVFDKGEMEDSEGVRVDFKNTVILLTSNTGSETVMRLCQNGKGRASAEELERALRPELLKVFKPAFLGRTVLVPYFPLGDDEIRDITRLKLGKIKDRFHKSHRADLAFDDSVVEAVVERCTEVESGARNVDHILTHTLLPELGQSVLEKMAEGQNVGAVRVSLGGDGTFVYELKDS